MTQILAPIMRDYENHRLTGFTYLILGVGLSLILFPKKVVLLALLFFSHWRPHGQFLWPPLRSS